MQMHHHHQCKQKKEYISIFFRAVGLVSSRRQLLLVIAIKITGRVSVYASTLASLELLALGAAVDVLLTVIVVGFPLVLSLTMVIVLLT